MVVNPDHGDGGESSVYRTNRELLQFRLRLQCTSKGSTAQRSIIQSKAPGQRVILRS
jgi:hypothetical protein